MATNIKTMADVKRTLNIIKKKNTETAAKISSKYFSHNGAKKDAVLKKVEGSLDDAWEEYKKLVVEVFNPKDPQDFLSKAQKGWANKGRELEFKLFLISGNIEDFNPRDNLPGYVSGDLTVEIVLKANKKIIDGQIKAAGGAFDLSEDTGEDEEKKLARKLERVMYKFSKDTLKKQEYQKRFEERIKKIKDSWDIRISYEGLERYAFEKSSQANQKKLIMEYMKVYFSTSASDYYLLGFDMGGKMRDFVISIPHGQAETFVETYTNMFKPEWEKRDDTRFLRNLRWSPAFGAPAQTFSQLLTKPDPYSYHLHGMYGQKHFSKTRDKAWGKRAHRERESHRKFLQSNPGIFEEPHTAFFGSDYSPINY